MPIKVAFALSGLAIHEVGVAGGVLVGGLIGLAIPGWNQRYPP